MLIKQRHCIALLLLFFAILGCECLFLRQSALRAVEASRQAKSPESQTKTVDEKAIRDLITQLGDESFDKREDAVKRLAAIGEPARMLVKKAATDSADAEIRQRAEEVLRALGFPALAVPDALALAKKPSHADAFKRSDIPAEVLAKMGTATGDAPKELVAVLGKADGKHLIISLSLTADGRYLAAGGKDENKVQIFDLKTGEVVKTIGGFAQQVRAVALTPDGKSLATGIKFTRPPLLSLWDTDTGALRVSPPGHGTGVMGLDISPDGKLLASAGLDRTMRVWDMATGAAVGSPIIHNTDVNRVAFSPDGKWLASASGTPQTPGAVTLMEAATGRVVDRLTGQAGELRGLAWHPDGQTLVSSSRSGTIWVWDLKTMKYSRALANTAPFVQAVAWHPSGHFLASNDHTRHAIILWDMRAAMPQPRVIQLFPPTPKMDAWTHDLIFTPEGRHLIAANPDGTVSVLRLAELGQTIK